MQEEALGSPLVVYAWGYDCVRLPRYFGRLGNHVGALQPHGGKVPMPGAVGLSYYGSRIVSRQPHCVTAYRRKIRESAGFVGIIA